MVQSSHLSIWPRVLSGLGVLISALIFSQLAYSQVAPPDGTFPSGYITARSPTFEWSIVPGASSYEFVLMDETDSTVYFSQAGIDATSFTITGAVFDQSKVYHWKVRAYGTSGSPGPFSEVESFLIYDPALIPNLQAPAGYITTSTPVFRWAPVPGAVSYDLWILTQDEKTTIDMVGGISETSYRQPSNAPFPAYAVYHYRVRALMPDGTRSLWANPGSFMVFSANDVPHLIGPRVQAPLGMMNFSWIPLESAVGYEFMLMSEDEQRVLVHETNLQVNGYAPRGDINLELGVVYHWKVRTVLASGARSIWSETLSFRFFDPSIVPDPILPFGFIHSSRPLLSWSQIEGAVGYQVEVRDSATQALLHTAALGQGVTSYDLGRSMRLEREKAYDWRVRSILADGRVSVLSAPRSFRITSTLWEGSITKLRMTARYYPAQVVRFSWAPLNLAGLGYVRYQVVLRVKESNGSLRTLWSGDANPERPGELYLPSDVNFQPLTQYAWLVRAYNVDNVLIGQSKQVGFRSAPEVPDSFDDEVEKLAVIHQEQLEQLTKEQAAQREIRLNLNRAKVDALRTKDQELRALHVTQAQEQVRKNEQQVSQTLASQLVAMANLKAKRGVTAAQIAGLQAKHEKAVSDLRTKHASQKASLEAHQAKAIENLAKHMEQANSSNTNSVKRLDDHHVRQNTHLKNRQRSEMQGLVRNLNYRLVRMK